MEQSQQLQDQLSNVSSSSSPRRRKAPLNLDAALYLQSQASYVQEPNSNFSTGTTTLASTNSPKGAQNPIARNIIKNDTTLLLHHHHQQQQQQQVLSNAREQILIGPRCPNNSTSSLPWAFMNQLSDNDRLLNYNISVDYIDCISNNDLAKNPLGKINSNYSSINYHNNNNSSSINNNTMRGFSHCRKHLRFHRNRVEPSLAINENGTNNNNNNKNPSEELSNLSDNNSAKTNENTTSNESESLIINANNNNNLEQQQSTNNNNNHNNSGSCSSVLYPISVSEVKKRTYFIGQLSQDSLLGHEELQRYFPNNRVSIFVCTWNQNRKRAPMNLNDLLLPDKLIYMPDIYAIGIQEAFSSQNDYLKEWEIELQTTLGPNHVLLHSCSLGVLHLALFVRRDLIWFCSTPEESVYNSRSMPTNMIKTKGAVSIAFRFFGTSFMFTNCHFPAHENKLKDRIDEYQRIINSIDLPKNLKLLKPRYLSNDSTARFDCCFFMGDLNFRLEQRTFDETINILEDIFQSEKTQQFRDRNSINNNNNNNNNNDFGPSFEILTQNDELLKVMETNQAFNGFDECQIKFPPTYKFLAQTNKYDRQTKRVPSYTDRILFRSKRQRHIQCLIYDWLPQLLSSDHKPVYCLFDVLVRPGHEQNMVTSLNAGLFQRTIYLEALKRRAEDPESMKEDGNVGSLICSIS